MFGEGADVKHDRLVAFTGVMMDAKGVGWKRAGSRHRRRQLLSRWYDIERSDPSDFKLTTAVG